MEVMVKKYQHKFRKVREEMNKWEELQSRLLLEFTEASSIIQRLPLLRDSRNYDVLRCVEGIEEAVLAKQMESLQNILLSMDKTLAEFSGVVSTLEKIVRDSKQLVNGGSIKLTTKQLHQRIGIKPTLAYCLDKLGVLHEMHQSEYNLKCKTVSALSTLILNPSASDIRALHQLLVDQPCIPKDKVQSIYDIVFAEDIC